MSAFARKQLEKWGWKEGDGLGRNGAGMSSYIKTSRHNRATHNRDEKGNTYAGIGHESTRGAGAGFSERNNELESVFAEMAQQRKEKKKQQQQEREQQSSDSSSSSDHEDDDDGHGDNTKDKKHRRNKNDVEHDDSRRRPREDKARVEEEEDNADESVSEKKKPVKEKNNNQNSRPSRSRSRSKSPKLQPAAAPAKKSTKKQASSSSSDSSSDSDDGEKGDLTKMSDAELFARCGGVRLGRAGRHRLFDNKLKRIEEHNKSTTEADDPYASVRQSMKTKKQF